MKPLGSFQEFSKILLQILIKLLLIRHITVSLVLGSIDVHSDFRQLIGVLLVGYLHLVE
mgnify:CR=1 FL=1